MESTAATPALPMMFRDHAQPLPAALFVVAASFGSPTAAQGNVWIVDDDGGPGVDFVDLTSAVTAAAGGDLLVFRDGSYNISLFGPHVIDGKGLTLVADGVANLDWLSVQSLPASNAFAMRGFRGGLGYTFELSAAPVWLEDLEGNGGFLSSALSVASCQGVSVHRSHFAGLSSFDFGGFPGLATFLSAVHVYDCILEGGDGFINPLAPFGFVPGAAGLELGIGSFGFVSGSTLRPGLLGPADGGLQSGVDSESVLLDVLGGFDVQQGSQTLLPGDARSFSASASLSSSGVVREGESATLSWTGAPGELALLGIATRPDGLFDPLVSGSAVLAFPLLAVSDAGVIPAGGTLHLDVPIPELGAGVEGAVFFTQGAFVDPTTGGVRLGGGSVLALLDQAL